MPVSANTIPVTINVTESRSISPMTPSPSREIRGLRLFRAISKKLGRRSTEDNTEDADSRSSSTDSCSSTSAGRCSRLKKEDVVTSTDSGYRSASLHHISSSSSDSNSDIHTPKERQHHSYSAENIRKVFQNLSVDARSHSCHNTKENKRKSKKTPKRILRSPMTYTYVKGLSGLPTQRIPINQTRVYHLTNSNCSCNVHYMVSLHR